MPPCVDCGTETDRSVMYGPPDELRCPACVKKLQPVYDYHGEALYEPARPLVTLALVPLSAIATMLYWGQQPLALKYLVASPWPIWDGEVWRLLSSCLVHGGIIHLVFNLYWMWQFGAVVEQWLGSIRFLGLVVLLGAGSSAAQMLLEGSGIGLSGVVFGLFGLLYALRRDKDFAAEQMQPGVVQSIVAWFFICIVLTYGGVWRIGNAAHGSGALIGWLVGRAVLVRWRYLAQAGIAVGVLLLVGIAMYQPWNPQYLVYRAVTAERNNDLPQALYWCRKAAQARPGDAELQDYVQILERLVSSGKTDETGKEE